MASVSLSIYAIGLNPKLPVLHNLSDLVLSMLLLLFSGACVHFCLSGCPTNSYISLSCLKKDTGSQLAGTDAYLQFHCLAKSVHEIAGLLGSAVIPTTTGVHADHCLVVHN